MELILVRHGETEENVNKILLGHLNACLNKNGHSNSIEIADRLKQEAISGIYTSDLLRAVQSAGYIKRNHPTAYYQEDRRLRERDYGCFNGAPFDIFLSEYKDESAFSRPPDGESLYEFRKRIQDFYQEISRIYNRKDKVIAITHTGVIVNLLSLIEGNPLDEIVMNCKWPGVNPCKFTVS